MFCDQLYSGGGLSRHLASHLNQLPRFKGVKAFHLKITAPYHPHFLHVLIDGRFYLEDLDGFLRDIWLDCCGHLSKFFESFWGNEVAMDLPINRAFKVGSKLNYAYDFGSTTELLVKCIHTYPVIAPDSDGFLLLSRNEPIEQPCDHCQQQTATYVCSVHVPGEEEMYFCDACSEIHEEECPDAEYSLLPMVNSPRSGVCAYDGGAIDVERDRVVT